MPAAKKTSSKAAVKKTVKPAAKKVAEKKTVKTVIPAKAGIQKKEAGSRIKSGMTSVQNTLSVALFDNAGKAKGTVTLPEAVFGGKVNTVLMAQAVRVYLANQRMGAAVTKTRGQVDGSTRKIYRQKGTGRARHGGIRAPIFVGGGVAHGPKMKDYSLDLPAKMRKAAVVSALSAMAKSGKVVVVAGLEKLEPKTKLVASALVGMGLEGKKALVVMPEYVAGVLRSARNIKKVSVTSTKTLNTYEVLNSGTVVVMQDALGVLEKMFASVRQAQDKKESK